MGNIRFLVKEGLKGCDIPSTGADHPIDGIYSSGKGICPKEVGSSCIFQQGSSLIQNASIHSLSNAVLLWHVWN